ncbi:bifunctional AP-4-A phosphorylase/ADP sulfurylase [Podospora conica]|nr:bifunctional AP-4-A phosphorylase/ADP sulfurylase [Schizothecium conicum]
MSPPTETMAPFTAPRNLPELVKAAFSRARASSDVNFYPTEATILNVNSLPFQLRFSPSLANKPKPGPPPSDTTTTPTKPHNPFASPSPALLITPQQTQTQTHYLILNKFAIVPRHFILATTTFEPQTHLLTAADLSAAYACVSAYRDCGQELFAFFNSGPHSGASQAHRHVQFLEVAGMREGLAPEGGWEVWAERMMVGGGDKDKVPFRVFAAAVGGGMSGEEMRGVYLGLYRRACEALGVEGGDGEGEARVSYNMAMTKDVMVVMPRVAEGAEVRDGEGRVVGKLALNGTVLAGTGLVKSREEWEALRADPGQVEGVLRRIGVLNMSVQARAEL